MRFSEAKIGWAKIWQKSKKRLLYVDDSQNDDVKENK